MSIGIQRIKIKVVNNPAVLLRVIQIVKRRRINIDKLLAVDENVYDARINLDITADDEQMRLLKGQLDKLVDVVEVIEA